MTLVDLVNLVFGDKYMFSQWISERAVTSVKNLRCEHTIRVS